jgi:Ca2+:H+ antiporter
MARLFKEILGNPVLWLLAIVPVVIVAQALGPEAPTLLLVLSVPAIVRMVVGEAA